MRPLLERLGGFLPAAIALALPTAFLPGAVDSFVLPLASLVIAGACLGVGLALLTPGWTRLGLMRWPMVAAVTAMVTSAKRCIRASRSGSVAFATVRSR